MILLLKLGVTENGVGRGLKDLKTEINEMPSFGLY